MCSVSQTGGARQSVLLCAGESPEQKGIPSVVYGPGDLRLAHAANESVSVDETIAACKAFALLAMDWCGVDEG